MSTAVTVVVERVRFNRLADRPLPKIDSTP